MSNCKITIRRNVRGKVQTKRYDSVEDLFKDLNFEEIPSEFLPKSAKKELIFGIPAGEGRLTTNLDSSEFEFLNINPTNPEHSNEGRLYLGTESAVPGVLIPSAVRKKDMSEVDLNKEVPLMQQLKSFISQISEAAIKGDEATASQRIQDLRNIIYVGSKAGIPINLRTENNGPITSTYLAVSRGDQIENILIKETELTKDDSAEGGFRENINVEKNTEEVSQELTQALVNVKAPFQVNKNDINGKWTIDRTLDYNNVLAEADVLTTNLEKNEVSQAYFVMNPLNSKLEEVKVNNAPIKTAKGTGGVSSTDSPLGREVTIEEGTFRVREGNKVYDSKNNPVTNKETILKVITHDYLNNLSKEELEAITFKGREIPGIKSLHLGQTFQLMPNNRVWAGNRYLPTNDSTHNLIMEMNEKRKAEVKSQTPITSEVLSDMKEEIGIKETQRADIERRRQEVKEKIGQNKDATEIRKSIVKDTKINGKSLKEAMINAGYVDFMEVLIHPNTPVEIFERIDSEVFEHAKKEGVEFFNYQENEGNHGMMQTLSDNTGKKHGIMLSSGLKNLSSYRTEQAKIERTNHLVLHEIGHIVWETKLTQKEKENAEKLELKSNYARSVTDSAASRHEENYVENYAAALTQKMFEYSFLPSDQLNEELQQEINAKYDEEIAALESKTTTPEGNDIITEEIPLFGKKETESKEIRVRKRPKKGGVTNTALDSQQSSEMTTEQIQEEINRQKEYQKKNCPEIKP